MMEKFKTLIFVKSSLIFLYLAFTIPIPLISNTDLKIFAILSFVFGLYLIINLTNDYVETSDEQISYKSTFLSGILGKKSWVIFWRDIKLIKSYPTSQGSQVYYFITKKNESFLIPQRIENFDKFVSIISNKTNLNTSQIKYLSPLWTYKLLTYISLVMIIGEIIAFAI